MSNCWQETILSGVIVSTGYKKNRKNDVHIVILFILLSQLADR